MGIKVDTTPDFGLPPGVYHVEVASAVEQRSKSSGAGMFKVSLVALDHGKKRLCYDYIMLEGAAKGIGIGKLKRLGLDMSAKERVVEADELIGKRCYINLVQETFEGRNGPSVSLKVGRLEQTDFGYFAEDNAPAGVILPKGMISAADAMPTPDDDLPF
jgi:hypothetical protein